MKHIITPIIQLKQIQRGKQIKQPNSITQRKTKQVKQLKPPITHIIKPLAHIKHITQATPAKQLTQINQ